MICLIVVTVENATVVRWNHWWQKPHVVVVNPTPYRW